MEGWELVKKKNLFQYCWLQLYAFIQIILYKYFVITRKLSVLMRKFSVFTDKRSFVFITFFKDNLKLTEDLPEDGYIALSRCCIPVAHRSVSVLALPIVCCR